MKNDTNSKTVFRRVRGRIVPIKVSITPRPKRVDAQDIATAGVNASVATTTTYTAFKKAANLFRSKSAQAFRLARTYKATPPTMKLTLSRTTKAGKVRKKSKLLEPDIFQRAQFRKDTSMFAKRTAQRKNLIKMGSRLKKVGRFAGKAALPASIIFGAATGIASLGDTD